MARLCLIGLCCLLMLGVSSALSADQLSKYLLPDQQFQDWFCLKATCTETTIEQMWRQPLADLPKGVTGYLMVIYQVVEQDSAALAGEEARKLSLKDQFNDYVGKGYTLTSTPWQAFNDTGVVFTLRGLAHTSDTARVQSATIYNLAFAADNRVVRLQVRQACTAEDLTVLDRALKKANEKTLAEDLAIRVVSKWTTPVKVDSPVPPAPQTNEVVIPSTPTGPVAGMTEKPATVDTPPAAPPAAPAAPAGDPPVAHPAETPPTLPTATPPATVEPAPPTIEAPKPPTDAPRWKTADGLLSMILPAGWTVSTKAPYTFSGLPKSFICLYPWEPYKSDEHRDRMLKSFVAAQQEIALKDFSHTPFTPDDAVGVTVRYVNVSNDIVHVYSFAKSGRLWQLLISVPSDNTTLPGAVQAMIESLRVQ